MFAHDHVSVIIFRMRSISMISHFLKLDFAAIDATGSLGGASQLSWTFINPALFILFQ